MKMNKIGGIGYFNVARGLGMLYVLLGHSAALFTPETNGRILSGAGWVLSSGVMVMFFMISGYGFFKRRPRKCIHIQTKLLLKPYWITALSILISKMILLCIRKNMGIQNVNGILITYLFGLNAIKGAEVGSITFGSISILWFIIALFGGWILYNGIAQIPSRKTQNMVLGGCIILGILLTRISKIWPFCLPMILFAAAYIAAGAWMRKEKLLERKIQWWVYGILLICIIPSLIWGDIDILGCKWKLGIIDVISSFILGFLFMKVYVFCMKKIQGGWFLDKIESIGMHSLWIMCIHGYEKVMIPWYRLEMYFPSGISTVICCIGRGIVIWVLFQCIQWIRNRSRRGV